MGNRNGTLDEVVGNDQPRVFEVDPDALPILQVPGVPGKEHSTIPTSQYKAVVYFVDDSLGRRRVVAQELTKAGYQVKLYQTAEDLAKAVIADAQDPKYIGRTAVVMIDVNLRGEEKRLAAVNTAKATYGQGTLASKTTALRERLGKSGDSGSRDSTPQTSPTGLYALTLLSRALQKGTPVDRYVTGVVVYTNESLMDRTTEVRDSPFPLILLAKQKAGVGNAGQATAPVPLDTFVGPMVKRDYRTLETATRDHMVPYHSHETAAGIAARYAKK